MNKTEENALSLAKSHIWAILKTTRKLYDKYQTPDIAKTHNLAIKLRKHLQDLGKTRQ